MIFFGPHDKTSTSPLVEHECLIDREIRLSEKYYLYLLKKKVRADKEVTVSLTKLERVKSDSSNIAQTQLSLESKIRQLEKISSDISQITP